jgi:hypothetical protein
MTVINNKQGAVKLSEVATDNAQTQIAMATQEDAMTVIERLRRVAVDAFRKNSVFIASSSSVTWLSGTFTIPANIGFNVFMMASPADASFANGYTTISYSSGSTTNWAIGNNEIVYIELLRSLIDATQAITLTDGINGVGTVGRRIRKVSAASFPYIKDPNDGTPEGTLAIPIAVRVDGTNGKKNLWWCPHGILWSEAVTAILGRVSTTTTIPIGGIIPFHIPSVTSISATQSVVNTYAPGFWLCDGSLITNAASPLYNENTPNLNSPVVYQPAVNGNANPADTGGNKFLRGSSNTGTTGGKSQVVVEAANMPDHVHPSSSSSYSGGSTHTHGSMRTSTLNDLFHIRDGNGSDGHHFDSSTYATNQADLRTSGPYVGTEPNTWSASTRASSTTSTADRTHSHGGSGNNGGNSGSNPIQPYAAPHENQPPYFNAVFIMRIF